MTVCFYKIYQNNMLYGENVLDENYICAITEGDWKGLEVFIECKDDKNIR